MTAHHQQLVRSVAEECGGAVRFDPNARAFEAFSFGANGSHLLDPVSATSLDDALAEVTERHGGDRGDRMGVREIGQEIDLLHVYAVRRTSTVTSWHTGGSGCRVPLSYKKRLEHICTINLRVISGEHVDLIGNPSLDEYRRKQHAQRQAQRPPRDGGSDRKLPSSNQ